MTFYTIPPVLTLHQLEGKVTYLSAVGLCGVFYSAHN